LLLVVASLFAAASARPATSIDYFKAIESEAAPVVGHEYYSRHCFMYEKGKSETTNYWRGTLVPINSKVTLISLDNKNMVLRLANGETVKVENVENFSKRSMAEIAHNLLTAQPVPIETFDAATARAIKNGVMKIGMTKEQVVMARGYPPGHKTSSLDMDTWTYWTGRFVVQTIVFTDGVLTQGRGLQ
jgi:hypothetical protein